MNSKIMDGFTLNKKKASFMLHSPLLPKLHKPDLETNHRPTALFVKSPTLSADVELHPTYVVYVFPGSIFAEKSEPKVPGTV